ncbi:pantetheine-phosphate adenylyltransferase [bacterium]|nr:pantetheine-phosphate adenylyltransferase [bacterium]
MRIAVYPGTFDPVTNGHLDVMMRALSLSDRLIIGVADRAEKNPLFSATERAELIRDVLKNEPRVEVATFSGLLIEFARSKDAAFIIRGLRAVSDFDYELQLALANRKLAPQIETVFLMPAESYIFISSSIVKEIARFGGDVSELCPASVEEALKLKFSTP